MVCDNRRKERLFPVDLGPDTPMRRTFEEAAHWTWPSKGLQPAVSLTDLPRTILARNDLAKTASEFFATRKPAFQVSYTRLTLIVNKLLTYEWLGTPIAVNPRPVDNKRSLERGYFRGPSTHQSLVGGAARRRRPSCGLIQPAGFSIEQQSVEVVIALAGLTDRAGRQEQADLGNARSL
jgi:hypothetical protein